MTLVLFPACLPATFSFLKAIKTRLKEAEKRQRKINNKRFTISASLMQSQPRASVTSSPIISQYFTPWSSWSACSEPCGYGVRARSRTCQNPQILLGGHVCSGPSVQHGFCFVKACPGRCGNPCILVICSYAHFNKVCRCG